MCVVASRAEGIPPNFKMSKGKAPNSDSDKFVFSETKADSLQKLVNVTKAITHSVIEMNNALER